MQTGRGQGCRGLADSVTLSTTRHVHKAAPVVYTERWGDLTMVCIGRSSYGLYWEMGRSHDGLYWEMGRSSYGLYWVMGSCSYGLHWEMGRSSYGV